MKGAGESAPNGVLPTPVTPEEERAQLEKVLRSEVFRTAPGLKRFLEFVAYKAIEGLSHAIKEYTIGAEVFGRTAEYDPKIDTVVRVQAHRLREKLKEYYSGEGAQDRILLAIPKGHYVPCFSRRPAEVGREFQSPQPLTPFSETAETIGEAPAPKLAGSPTVASAGEPKKKPFLWLPAGLAGMALLLGVAFVLPRLRSHRSTEEPARVPYGTPSTTNLAGPLKDLWADFLKDESSPIVAFSNAVFLGTETADLLRLKSEEVDNLGALASRDLAKRLVANPRLLERTGPVFFEDLYTGTGEVMAVFYLTRLFAEFYSSLAVKRSRLVTTDDLTRRNVIFLGSPGENALLAGLPLTQDFVFRLPAQPVRLWRGGISNLRPQAGESSWYEIERDPKTQVLRADYALVSFLPGIAPNRRIAILGGLTTLGTQAAADFATSPSHCAELAARLGTGPGTLRDKIPPFSRP